ncbi:MAG: RdgB/HAM1 family non-canonical purine NTP pyrophosphatase [Melioribacteraceae bacterium]|nr:RdgB/HAM1 family non-canonical purine NTP pyrophosphatase [Melioribacteraceae bacterium]MCF8265389.1 RdgB/HAM1 family non-canonical purine NTP pyrophosphatase [Melioribacteraceae bacterium]MCF8412039.1 RdgB/HAM1 family non-canonical purine NTP pyrophosphatase [Melioribacteraceae bacterium]
MKSKLVFATGNLGKLNEVKELFADKNVQILSIHDFDGIPEIIENGETFSENAFIKADTIFEITGLPTIADDSGLVVFQLNGEPGIYSARYAGENCTYEDNNRKIIAALSNFDKPHLAKFVSCAVYVDKLHRIECIGELEGELISEFRGSNGFGYDPIFVPSGSNKTLAEVSLLEKNKESHRAKAFNKLKLELTKKEIL